jgi:hypothetical protein
MMGGHWRKSASDREAKLKYSTDVAFGKNFKISSFFIEASEIFIFIFLSKNAASKPTTHVKNVQI